MMSLFSPDSPETPRPAEPEQPTPTPAIRERGLAGVVRRKPRLAFWSTLGLSLLVGLLIGAAAGVDQTTLDAANSRADRAETRAGEAESQLVASQERLTRSQRRSARLATQVRQLSAKGEVPSFVGEDIEDARRHDALDSYDWKVRTQRAISDAEPGTVVGQNPAEGSTLKAGRSITLTVAKKAPPKPKEWVTIESFSGASSTKTPEFTVPEDAKARIVYSMPQDGNNAIIVYRKPNEYVDLMLNEIGPQSGSTRMYESGTFYLDVTGAYDIQIQVYQRPG
jgi:hypothetical protein